MSLKLAAKQVNEAIGAAKSGLAQAESAVMHYTAELQKANAAWEALKPLLSPDEMKFDTPVGAKAKSGAKPASKPHAKNLDAPGTDFAFWLSLITTDHQKTETIIKAAAAKLEVTDPAVVEILKPRMSAFLSKAVDEKKIESKGERFNRVYFLPA
jgi:hypothetical protein